MSKNSPSPRQDYQQELPSRAMQWTVLIVLAVLTLIVLILPLITAYITKNVFYLIPTVGSVPLGFMWRSAIRYVFPKRKEDYDLEAIKLLHQAPKRQRVGQRHDEGKKQAKKIGETRLQTKERDSISRRAQEGGSRTGSKQ